jgi:hypothetical protein
MADPTSKADVIRVPFAARTLTVPLAILPNRDKAALDSAVMSIRAASNILRTLSNALMASELLQERISSEQGESGRN